MKRSRSSIRAGVRVVVVLASTFAGWGCCRNWDHSRLISVSASKVGKNGEGRSPEVSKDVIKVHKSKHEQVIWKAKQDENGDQIPFRVTIKIVRDGRQQRPPFEGLDCSAGASCDVVLCDPQSVLCRSGKIKEDVPDDEYYEYTIAPLKPTPGAKPLDPGLIIKR